MKYTDEEIEEFYIGTAKGCYLKSCAMNDPGEGGDVYFNTLDAFIDGFRCAEKLGEDA